MPGDNIDIRYVAHLARLELTAEEEERLRGQLADVLGYVAKLRELEVSHVEPTAHAVRLVNVTRADEVVPSFSQEVATANAPTHREGLFIVPKIVE